MLTIHGVPISVHTRKVILAAIEKGIPYHNEPVIPFHPPAGWDDLSPTGKIPVLTEDDLTLRDSSVICAYLEKTQPSPPLYPTEAKAFADALWLEEYADGTVFREVVHGLLFQKMIRPKILNQTTDNEIVAKILETGMPKVFDYLERSVMGEFLVGERFGIADIAVMSNLINFHYIGFAIDGGHWPRLQRYFGRLLQHPSIRAALAKEAPVVAKLGLDTAFLKKADLAFA
jgi:glutathione S-transferase